MVDSPCAQPERITLAQAQNDWPAAFKAWDPEMGMPESAVFYVLAGDPPLLSADVHDLPHVWCPEENAWDPL